MIIETWFVSIRGMKIFHTGLEGDAQNLFWNLKQIEDEYGMDLKIYLERKRESLPGYLERERESLPKGETNE